MKAKFSIRQYALHLVAIVGLAAMASAQAAPILMKLGTATNYDTQFHWMEVYAKMVDHDSHGRIKVEVYPASQLGSIGREIEGTQFGSIQGWVGPPEFLSGVDSRYEVLSAAGLFKNMAHAHRTLQDPTFNRAFLALGANKGLKGIGLFLSGPMVFATTKPVRNLAELAGKKIRVLASDLQMDQVRRLGATPVPMTLGDVMPALQQGALDGIMTAEPILAPLHFYSAAPYMFETKHAYVTSMTVISKIWFDKLPHDLQKIVVNDGRKVSKGIYAFASKFNVKQRKAWLKDGGKIFVPTAAEHARIMKLVRPIGAEVTAKKPGEKALYKLLLKAVKETE